MEDNSKLSNQTEVLHRKRFALVLLVILLAIFLKMISSLLLGVILGVILAAISERIFLWFEKRMKGRRKLAAASSLITTIFLFIVPVALLAILMAADGIKLANDANEWFKPYQPKLEETLDRFTYSGKINLFGYDLEVGSFSEKLKESVGSIATFLISLLKKTVGGMADVVLLVFIALYTLYFVYLDGKEFWEWLKKLLPLRPEQSEKLRNDFLSTSLATLKTLGVIGVVQGVMGGIGFWVCGIPGVLFWSILMAICSVIPLVGAHIIIIPAVIILMLIGKIWYGIGLFLWAWLVISNIDNFLRPILIGRQTELHELVVFLSTVGGIVMFGFFGFLIGPVIATLLKVSLEIYREAFLPPEEKPEFDPET